MGSQCYITHNAHLTKGERPCIATVLVQNMKHKSSLIREDLDG